MDPFPWSTLLDELRENVVKFLPCRERARVSVVAKSVRKACLDAETRFPLIKNARLPESIGRPFSYILNALRYGVYQLGLAGKISPRAQMLLSQGPCVDQLQNLGMHEDVASLNSAIFSFWDSDYSGRPNTGVYNYLTQIDKLNPKLEFSKYFSQIQHWPTSRLHGHLYVLMERADGTVVVSEDMESVYLTQGIVTSLGTLLKRGGQRLPSLGIANFLPFEGYVAFDGMIGGALQPVTATVRKELYRAYCAAMDGGTLITALPLRPLPDPPSSSSTAATLAPSLTPLQQQHLQRIRQLPKPSAMQGDSWVLRRMGYSEQENPEHMVVVLNGKGGMPITMGATTSLHPSATELFDLVCEGLFGGRDGPGAAMLGMGMGMMGMGMPGMPAGSPSTPPTCPSVVMTDERAALAGLQALLEPVGIAVHYYPPPTQEEEFAHQHIGGCATCHIPQAALVGRGREPLKQCVRCKEAQYCSRECQKAHWKEHKKVCTPAVGGAGI